MRIDYLWRDASSLDHARTSWLRRSAFASDEILPTISPPTRIGEPGLKNRGIVSLMDKFSTKVGAPVDFHLVHIGSKGLRDAALVMTEMVCVSSERRIT